MIGLPGLLGRGGVPDAGRIREAIGGTKPYGCEHEADLYKQYASIARVPEFIPGAEIMKSAPDARDKDCG